ncbi:hypothetical protein C3408_15850 [Candidatus Pantoea alvi]|nr:hypothetical protein C3408_15850 [Pantoea alvi]
MIIFIMLTEKQPVSKAYSSCTKLMKKSISVKDINLISACFVPTKRTLITSQYLNLGKAVHGKKL